MVNWKAKRNNKFEHKKKEFVPNRNFKNNNTKIFLVISSKGTKLIHRPIQIIKGIKNLLTTTVTIQRILNERNPSSVGNVMVRITHQSAPIRRILLATYTQYRRR